MFCPNCGKEIPDTAKHCRFCGTEVTPLSDGEAAAPEENTPLEEAATSTKDTPPEEDKSSPNMFTDLEKRKIPKSLQRCLETDPVSANLWRWCQRLESLGLFLFWAIIVAGSIIAFTTAFVETGEGRYADTEFDFWLFVFNLAKTALYAYLEYIVYHVLALLIGSAASVVQNTKISADVALYRAAVDGLENSPFDDGTVVPESIGNQMVRCPKCGSVQPSGRETCLDCGVEFR